MLRTFAAIELPPAIRIQIGDLIGRMRREFPKERLRFSPPENVHVTLKFLGATPENQVPEILAALESSLSEIPSFTLAPKGIGGFPPGRSPRVVWIGLEGDVERLAETAEAVETALNPLGFPRENRPFSPHLTVARSPRNAPRGCAEEVLQAIAGFDAPAFSAFRVGKVTLMESKLAQPHSVYTPLGWIPLAESGMKNPG